MAFTSRRGSVHSHRGGEILVSRETLRAIRDGTRAGEPRRARLKCISWTVELVPVIWS
jgi:hypothetical protein